MFGVKITALRDSTAEERRAKIQAGKNFSVLWMIEDSCRQFILTSQVLDALNVPSREQAFALMGTDAQRFCRLSDSEREAKLATIPTVKAHIDAGDLDASWLCLEQPFFETGFRTSAEIFTTLKIDPNDTCSRDEEGILTALKDNPSFDEVGKRLAGLLEQHVDSVLIPALEMAEKKEDRCIQEARRRTERH